MTTTVQILELQERAASKRYDKVNSKLCLWISYTHTWRDNYGTERSNQTYWLKFHNDKEYKDWRTELERAFKIIEENYVAGRAFKTIALYQNWNLGGTHPDRTIKNPMVFKIVEKRGQLEFQLAKLNGDTNGNVKAYIEEQFRRIVEIHNSI